MFLLNRFSAPGEDDRSQHQEQCEPRRHQLIAVRRPWRATDAILKPYADATAVACQWLSVACPIFVAVDQGSTTRGSGWFGIERRGAYRVHRGQRSAECACLALLPRLISDHLRGERIGLARTSSQCRRKKTPSRSAHYRLNDFVARYRRETERALMLTPFETSLLKRCIDSFQRLRAYTSGVGPCRERF